MVGLAKCSYLLFLHAELAFFQDDLERFLVLGRQAQSLLMEQSFLYPDNLATRGFEALFAGEVVMAWQCLLEGDRRSKKLDIHSSVFAISLLLGEVCLEQGQLRRARHYYQQALAHMDEDQEIARQQLLLETGSTEPFFVSWASLCLAQLAYECNELSDAQHHLSRALSLRAKPEHGIHVLASGSLVQVRLLYARGETQKALDLLLRWERHTHSPWSLRVIRTCRARLQLAYGDLAAVEHWVQDQMFRFRASVPEEDFPLLYQQEEALLFARLHIAQQRGDVALKALAFWKEKAQAQGSKRSVLKILLLEAQAYAVCQEHSQANTRLREALQLAQPENYQRLFLDEGPMMETLLKTLLLDLRESALRSYVRTLLYAFAGEVGRQETKKTPDAEGKSWLLEPLSEQEQRVLRLLVAGRSNPEIARELVVSINTVKTHVQGLYRKLNVHNRTEASEVARHLMFL